jgi:hypothetical protein
MISTNLPDEFSIDEEKETSTKPSSNTSKKFSEYHTENIYEQINNDLKTPAKDNEYQCLEISDSLRFLSLFDPSIQNNQFTLHPWQAEVNEDISFGRTRINKEVVKEQKPDSIHPYKFALCAANGSGKDAFVIAPLALWFICTKIKAKVIITSASGTQLTTQTEHYISTLAKSVNTMSVQMFGFEIIKIRKRHIYCTLSGSVIHLFATDEGEKAEGHHPTAPGCEMMIIVNEAKSVGSEIFDALRRCTGYNYWIDVSSPGEPIGWFYKHYTSWPNKRRVTYFDCPHQSPDEFEEDRRELGEHSPLFRSKWLALFTFIGGEYVVSQDRLEELRRKNRRNEVKPILQSKPIRIGLDIALSTAGDESTLRAWKGNKEIFKYEWRIQDSTLLTIAIHTVLMKEKIPMNHNYIFADDGGVGRAVIDQLNRMGYNINRVLNQSASKNKKQYRNKGAQSWYKFGRLIEQQILIFLQPDEEKLFSQIASRKYKTKAEGLDKLQLQSKKEMISEGLPSPDRADACVLAFTDVSLEEFLDEFESNDSKSVEIEKSNEDYIAELKYNIRHNKALVYSDNTKRKNAKGSLDVLLKHQEFTGHQRGHIQFNRK